MWQHWYVLYTKLFWRDSGHAGQWKLFPLLKRQPANEVFHHHGLEPLDGSHDDPTTVVSTFDLQRNSFPVTVESRQGVEGMEEHTLFLSMTPNHEQIMLMLKMTYAYLDNNNNGDLHRELLLPCLLCVMKNCVRKMNSLKLDVLNEDWGEHERNTQDAPWDCTNTANSVQISHFSGTTKEGKRRPNEDIFSIWKTND